MRPWYTIDAYKYTRLNRKLREGTAKSFISS